MTNTQTFVPITKRKEEPKWITTFLARNRLPLQNLVKNEKADVNEENCVANRKLYDAESSANAPSSALEMENKNLKASNCPF